MYCDIIFSAQDSFIGSHPCIGLRSAFSWFSYFLGAAPTEPIIVERWSRLLFPSTASLPRAQGSVSGQQPFPPKKIAPIFVCSCCPGHLFWSHHCLLTSPEVFQRKLLGVLGGFWGGFLGSCVLRGQSGFVLRRTPPHWSNKCLGV